MIFTRKRKRMLVGASLLTIVAATLVALWPRATPTTMLKCLPPGEAPVLYANVATLRRAGFLDQIAGKPGEEDPEYKQFVAATGFDYRKDLDAVLVELRAGTKLMVVSGHFDRDKLMAYAEVNGGLCSGTFCSMPGSRADRRISFHPLGGRLVAIAAGTDPMGAAMIKRDASAPMLAPPNAPVWLYLPASVLHAQTDLAPGWSAFLEAMEGAQRALLTIETSKDGLEVALTAPCATPEKAKAIEARLSSATATLQDLITKSGKSPEPTSPATVLAAGVFRTEKTVVRGRWPLSKAFFAAAAK